MSHLSIRLSSCERKFLKEQAVKEGLSLSTYVKKRLFQDQVPQYNVPSIMKILAEMSTEINLFKSLNGSEEIAKVENGVRNLWQILS